MRAARCGIRDSRGTSDSGPTSSDTAGWVDHIPPDDLLGGYEDFRVDLCRR